MESINRQDLLLVNNLCTRKYTENTFFSNGSKKEHEHISNLKKKLKEISIYFSTKYLNEYGPFQTCLSSGNPITRGGTFNNIWSGIYKGATNKQYAAQISFVMNRKESCLDVGFFFGSASAHSLSKEDRFEFETQLNNIGIDLSNAITNNSDMQRKYDMLFDLGFKPYINGILVSPNDWCNNIRFDTANSKITTKIYPNDFNIIESSTIDYVVSQIIFLMVAINNVNTTPRQVIIKPMTPEQRAKQAERQAQIGLKGELYVMEYERLKLKELGINNSNYPKHVALESNHYGFDILSLDENKNELFIEVKTTTRDKEDTLSKSFFLSNNEFEVYTKNKNKYSIFRVYDIENTPSVEQLKLDKLSKEPDGYIIKY